ncbi:unnamed protein product, partial [Hapterophycus canaliculatus]
EGARNVNNRFLTHNQLDVRAASWKRAAKSGSLQRLNLKKKTTVLLKNLTLEKRFTLLIAQENIPGVRRVLAQALKRGSSSHAILGKIGDALKGTYHGRGWKEEEKNVALLVLRLGGPSLLHVLQKTTGLPGLSYTRR